MAAVVTNFLDLDLTKEYTYADYLLWQFQERVELIKGFIMKMSPAPNRFHQKVSMNLSSQLTFYFRGKTCGFYAAPFDVRLPIKSKKKDTTVVQPDLCVICDQSKLDDQGCNGAPDLIIEILSLQNSKHDLDTKFKLYEEAGVKEYWIAHPIDKIVWVYTLQNDKYIGLKPFTEGETIDSPLFTEMKIEVNEVFYEN
jgi:Uma2 family endonuclease